MKLFPAAAAALALILSSPGLALTASTCDTIPSDPLAAHSADAMVSGYLDSLESLMDTDQTQAAALVKDLHAQCLRVKLPDSLKYDLAASSADLLRRMGEARVGSVDVELLRLEVVNARVSFGLKSMAKAAASNEWDDEEYHSAVMKWLGTTTIFNDAPDPSAYRARLTASLGLAMLQTTGTTAASQSLTVEMLRMRLAIAIRRYQLAYAQGQMTSVEFERLRRIAVIRVRRIIEEGF